MSAFNAVAPGPAKAVSFAMNPTVSKAIDVASSLTVPTAVANLVSSIFTSKSIGQHLMGTPDAMQSAESIAAANPNSADLTSQANSMEGDALAGLLGLTGAFGTANISGGTAGDVNGGQNGVTGGVSGEGGWGGSAVGGDTWADGGPINGPGTGTSDSINAKLSDGEYVMSADTVSVLGKEFFDALQAAFHTPVAQRA
jgi:hypothetical protein